MLWSRIVESYCHYHNQSSVFRIFEKINVVFLIIERNEIISLVLRNLNETQK